MASIPWARRDRGHHVPYGRRSAVVVGVPAAGGGAAAGGGNWPCADGCGGPLDELAVTIERTAAVIARARARLAGTMPHSATRKISALAR
jgi:hypothetical protein